MPSLAKKSAAVKAAQVAEVGRLEAKGDLLAAYWAGSASASVLAHYRAGAFVNIKGKSK